jgi:alkanesulfonate monooxygenase SsuD/methylene tetrahydromethanopterin reductase-like flavin-dependent oxidoreductase (luciferase family)
MRFDVFNLPTFDPRVDGEDEGMFERIRSLAALADSLGYDGLWLAEHHFQTHGGILSAPDVVLAGLAAAAPRMRLGLGVVQVPYHHPLSIAERVATLDQVCGGRLDVGLGRAFLKCEYDGFGVPMEESRARFNEGVEIVVGALRGPLEARDGGFVSFPPLSIRPRPRQRPVPPLWVAAATTPATFTWAGREGFNLMVAPMLSADRRSLSEKIDLYLSARDDAGHPPGEILVNVHVHVAGTDEEARADADAHLNRYVTETRAAGASAIEAFQRDGVPADFAHYPDLGRRWATFSVDNAIARNSVVIGAPETCIPAMDELIASTRATAVAGTFDFGQRRASVEESLRLFASAVIPKLAGTVR